MGSSKPAHDDFPRYLGALLKGAGMNADQIDGRMQPWWTSLAKNQKPLVGGPPRGSTLRNWLSRETQPTTDKLTPLCGFLLYGRVGEPPDWRKAQTMAQRLREGPYDTFPDDYRLTIVDGPALQRANAEVAKYKDDLMAAAIQALKETHQHIVSTFSEVAADPALMGTYFGAIAIGKKSLTHFDMLAETQLMRSLRRFDPGIDVFGEETLGDFGGWTSPFGVLGDALDGSDLLQQAISLVLGRCPL